MRGYESIESLSSTKKPMQFDESVASVERNWWKESEIAMEGAKEARRRLSYAEAHLESREWEQGKFELAFF